MMKNAMFFLQESCAKNGPLCIGLDTDPSYLPPELIQKYDSPAQAVLAYNKALIAKTAGLAGCFKVQIAYYEAMGIEGLKAYAQTLQAVRTAGVPVISDIKRGDIADTARAYAKAHFTGEFETDIITINPYMGFDTIEPFSEYVTGAGKGIFVLLRTSNPGMKDLELLKLERGGNVADAVGEELLRLADKFCPKGTDGCPPIGAVVGCTEESDARYLRDRYPNLFFLIPGYGAQGGPARIAATLLDKAGGTVNSSRGILTAWKKVPELADKTPSLDAIVDCAVQAAREAKNDLLGAKDLLAKQSPSGSR